MGGTGIGETPSDGSVGEEEEEEEELTGLLQSKWQEEGGNRSSFHQSHRQGSSTVCVVPSHQQHANVRLDTTHALTLVQLLIVLGRGFATF